MKIRLGAFQNCNLGDQRPSGRILLANSLQWLCKRQLVAVGAHQLPVEHAAGGKVASVAAANLILFQLGRHPVPDLHVDNRFMLAFEEHAFVDDLAYIDWAIEQIVDEFSRKSPLPQLLPRRRSPAFTAESGIFEFLVESRYVLRLYI